MWLYAIKRNFFSDIFRLLKLLLFVTQRRGFANGLLGIGVIRIGKRQKNIINDSP